LLAALQSAAADLPPPETAAILIHLGGVLCTVGARLAAGTAAEVAPPPEGFLTLAELAQRMKLGKSTIRAMVRKGEFQEHVHYRRVRRRLLFLWAPIERSLGVDVSPAAAPNAIVPFIRRGRRHD
jgi:hypothetical protein